MKFSASLRLLASVALLLPLAAPLLAQPVDPGLGLEPVVSGLGPITGVTHAGDGRLFVVEQPGRIRVVVDGQLLPQPFLDVSAQTSSDGERGLLYVRGSVPGHKNGLVQLRPTKKLTR